jgi:hypothetical protein
MTLVAAYERQIGGRGTEIAPGSPAPPVPDKAPVILHPEPAPAAPSPAAAPPPLPKAEKIEEAAAERAKPHRRHHIRRRHRHHHE